MKKLLSLLIACLSITCVSCGQDVPADELPTSSTETVAESTTETEQNEVSAFVGKWQGVKIIEDGKESDIFVDIPVYALYQFEFCEDGSVKLGETTAKIAGNENSWKWNRTSKSNEIEFFDSEDDRDINILTLDGDYLVGKENDDILYLEKVDEFTPYSIEEETTEKTTHEYIKADPKAFIGKWEVKKLTVKKDKSYLMSEPLVEICQLEICDDYTAVISGVEISGSEKPVTYKWGMVSETEIELVDDNGNIICFTMESDYLVCTENKITVSLVKVDEFTPKESEETENSAIKQFVGKWQGEYAVDENGKKFTDDSIPMLYQFEFNEDGTLSFGGFLAEVHDKGDYTWKVDDSETITLHYSGSEEDINLSFNGKYLMYSDYKEIYLAKVDEFVPYNSETETTKSETEQDEVSAFVGKWQGEYAVDKNGKKITDDIIPEFYQFELKENGVVSLGEIPAGINEPDSLYSWEYVDENTIKFDGYGVTENMLVDMSGNYRIYNTDSKDYLIYKAHTLNGETEIYLEKVDEFIPVDFDEFYQLDKSYGLN